MDAGIVIVSVAVVGLVSVLGVVCDERSERR